jgi:hypothetical protein
MVKIVILHLHLAATPLPIDNLHLCEYEAQRLISVDEDNGDPGTRALQLWIGGFLPSRDDCGQFQ